MHAFYGSEYPQAVILDGIRMPLKSERRFARFYENDAEKRWALVSRFSDGSAAMTLSEMRSDWPNLSTRDRTDFCLACSFLSKRADFPDMIRFIMSEGSSKEHSLIAQLVASRLPREEAIDCLSAALRDSDPDCALNINHALITVSKNES